MIKKRYIGVLSIDDKGEGVIELVSEERVDEFPQDARMPEPVPGRA
ncbi:MAG: hypothetical protein U9M95_01560 [Candidatus Altiarchaeota archaeon]|nr:hypothetical protein [Candidatus Altiarchaeota archaeon]